jgi:hypothetical protein
MGDDFMEEWEFVIKGKYLCYGFALGMAFAFSISFWIWG